MSSTVLMKWDWPRIRLPPSGISSGIVFSSMKDVVYRNYLNILRPQMERPFLDNLVGFEDLCRFRRVVGNRRWIVRDQRLLQVFGVIRDDRDGEPIGAQVAQSALDVGHRHLGQRRLQAVAIARI